MVLLVSCLVLLAQLGSAQKSQDKEDNHGAILQVGFRTSFSCVGRVTGYYADIESGCQLYHMCDGEGRRFTHACPNATLFQQRMMICNHWYMVNCNNSEHDYSANLLIGQRDKPFVSAEEHLHHREPVKFFTIHQRPGSLQQPNWFPSVGDQIQEHLSDTENTVHSKEPSSISVAVTQGRNSDSKGERQARNRNFNSDISYTRSSPPSSTKLQRPPPPSYSVNQRPVAKSSDSTLVNSQYFQTESQHELPNRYTSNPFLQSLTIRPTPATNPNYVNNNSQVQINLTAQSEVTQRISGLNTPAKLEDLANIRTSAPKTVSGQSQLRIHFGSSSTQNLPHEIREPKIPDAYTNNPFFQSLIRTRESAELSVTTPHSTDISTIQGSKIAASNGNDLNNIVELHLLDPRRMFFIPGTDGIIHESRDHDHDVRNSTVLFIPLPVPHDDTNISHGIMRFRNNIQTHEDRNPECPNCHPSFLLPGRCHPCVIIR